MAQVAVNNPKILKVGNSGGGASGQTNGSSALGAFTKIASDDGKST
jgi:hypothetical protein